MKPTSKFKLGQLRATPGALDAIANSGEDTLAYVARHAGGDWGVVSAEDKEANEQALVSGTRLLSAYILKNGGKIWVITEADRESTTLLLPDEY